MKAWRIYGVNDLRYEDVDYPKLLSSKDVILKVTALQLSTTEIDGLKFGGDESLGTETNQSIPHMFIRKRLEQQRPLDTLGHEYAAEIVQMGEDVKGFAVGDRVVAAVLVPCLKCVQCLSGHEDRCTDKGSSPVGALREFVTVPSRVLLKIPDNMSDGEGATVNPAAVAVGCVADADIHMGDNVVVLGVGSLSLTMIQLLRHANVGKIIATGRTDSKLKLAKSFGADVVINSSKEDAVASVLKELDGVGADIAFECAGGPRQIGFSGSETLNQAVGVVKRYGTIIQIALLGPTVTIRALDLQRKAVRYIFPVFLSNSMKYYRLAIDWIGSGKIDVKSTITHQLKGLDKLPESMAITMNKSKYNAINSAQVIMN